MRARSSTGWTGGAATYDSGLRAHTHTRPAPGCSALLCMLNISHKTQNLDASYGPASAKVRKDMSMKVVYKLGDMQTLDTDVAIIGNARHASSDTDWRE